MGDMAETFAAMRAHKQERRDKRAAVNMEALQKLGIPAREQSKNVFRVDTEWGAVMYYPSSSMWQHKGKTHRGSAGDFKVWLSARGFLQ